MTRLVGPMPGTHSAGTVQRRLRGHKDQPAQVIHRQVAQEASHSGSDMSADMRRPRLHNATCPTRVHTDAQLTYSFTDVHRHSSLKYTYPSSSTPSRMLTHHFPHTPSSNTQLECIQTCITYTHKHTCCHLQTLSTLTPFTSLLLPGTPMSLHLPCSAPATGPRGSGCWTPEWTGRN